MKKTLTTLRAIGLLAAAAAVLAGAPAFAQEPTPTIEEKTAGMQAIPGFIPLFWEDATGKLYAEFGAMDEEFLYQVSLASGLGSNPVGLDRGQLSMTAIFRPTRIGPRVLLLEPNYRYRAVSDNPDEVRAVRDAFAPSVHWGFAVAAATDDRVLVDATDFFLRDTHGAAARIRRAGQGSFTVDRGRSAFYLPHTKGFPDNSEVETMLTFTSDAPGRLVSGVAASGETITLRQHHSLVRLPGPGFETRVADPRIGVNGPQYMDYATPIDQRMTVRLAARHRLHKKDPAAERSEPVEPIVYYLDRGAPEPIRSALLDGARWWNEAFEAAGFIDAFRVEVLPEGADAQDIRYNMIHWTHRRTRGWSYGGSVQDPRTGEIIKGNVNLGSLRLRQDHLHGVGLVAPYDGASGFVPSGLPPDPAGPHSCGLSGAPGFSYLAQVSDGASPVELALARVRQLSAHEVGHTLGFPHNYMASTYGGRASVMDYPAPLAVLEDGAVSLDDAYGVGVGSYDVLSVRWAYGHFPPDRTASALDAIVREGLRSETRFLAHTDNYIGAGAHPLVSVWDNGGDLVRHLEREIEIRQAGLDAFGEKAIRPGEAMSLLEPVLVPLYLHHRFQMKAAMNTIGGQEYYYAVRGDGQRPVAPVPGDRQRHALEVVLRTLGNGLPRLAPADRRHDSSSRLPGARRRDFRRPHRTRVRSARRRGCCGGLHRLAAAPPRADGSAREQPRDGPGPAGARGSARPADGEDLGRRGARGQLPARGSGCRRTERAERHEARSHEPRQSGPRAGGDRGAAPPARPDSCRGGKPEPPRTAGYGGHPPLPDPRREPGPERPSPGAPARLPDRFAACRGGRLRCEGASPPLTGFFRDAAPAGAASAVSVRAPYLLGPRSGRAALPADRKSRCSRYSSSGRWWPGTGRARTEARARIIMWTAASGRKKDPVWLGS